MSLQEFYYVAEMVVGLAVIISIIFVAIELRQNTFKKWSVLVLYTPFSPESESV